MTTMMSNVAIITSLPKFQLYFENIKNIELYSRLMLTIPSFIIAIFAPFLGHFIFKFGKKRSATIALFGFGLIGSSGLYLENVYLYLFSRALFGVAVAILMIVSTSLVGDYFQGEQRHKFMGLQSAFMSIGGICFVVLGGFLSDINWKYPFGIYFLGFILLPFTYFFLVEKNKKNLKKEEENILPSNLLGIYFLAFFYMLIFFILPTQLPFLIINHFGASGKFTGIIIGIAFFANALGAITFTLLKKRFSFSSIYILGILLIAIGFTGISFIKNVQLFYITSPILGFGGGIMMTNISAWMLSKTSFEKRVKASGYLTASLFLGQFFSPIVLHPIISYFGVQGFFGVIGVFLFVLVILSFLLKR